MNDPMSAKATISAIRRSTSRRDSPSSMPLMTTFSRPVISGWKPAPSSISAVTRPSTATVPEVGRRIPLASLSSVDLPEPLGPITATASPGATSRSMPSRATNSSNRDDALQQPAVEQRALEGLVAAARPPPAEDLAHADTANRSFHTDSTRVSR